MYCTIVALALSLFRIIADLALGFAIVHHSSWSFLIASLVDLLLAVTASAAAWFAVKERRYGIIVFSIISFLETALYSAIYFLIVVIEVRSAWKVCGSAAATAETATSRCDQRASELSSHGLLLILLGFHLSMPTALLQLCCAYFVSKTPRV